MEPWNPMWLWTMAEEGISMVKVGGGHSASCGNTGGRFGLQTVADHQKGNGELC